MAAAKTAPILPDPNGREPIRSHLVCYAAGERVHFLNRARLIVSARRCGIQEVHSFGPESLAAGFRVKHRAILDTPGGFWLWKPYLILEAMNRAAAEDIILYVDAGAYFRQSPEILWRSASAADAILFENDY